jgi:hypothetical protein
MLGLRRKNQWTSLDEEQWQCEWIDDQEKLLFVLLGYM